MQLIKPTVQSFESYRAAIAEFEAHGVTGIWSLYGPLDDPETYVGRMESFESGKDLPEHLVPASMYWLVDGSEFIGYLSIRHRLNESLEQFGGHIGYGIRPTQWNRGYGSRILELGLPKAREWGIERALLTCNKQNVASRRIIEKNGGVLRDEINVDGRAVLRFWIVL